LRESEEKLRNFVGSATVGIWCFRGETPVDITLPEEKMIKEFFKSVCVECNEIYARMMGTTKEEILGTKLSEVMHDTEKNREYLAAFIHNGFRLSGGISHEINRKGEEKYFSNSLVGTIKNGKIIEAWGTQTDITDLRKMEEALRKSEEKYRGIVRNAVEGIYRSTVDGKILEANPALLEFFGYESEEEFKVDAFRLFLHPERRENFLKELEEKGEVKGYEIEYKRKDGKIVIGNEFARLVEEDGRKIIEGIIHDITKRKEAERKLEESHKKLQQSYERIKEESSLKMEFVRDTSHQFINPLCIVDGYLYLLKKGEFGNLTTEQKKTIDRIHKNFLRINELVQKTVGMDEEE
jgi:PAS domain S-box-containing protein